MLALISVIIIKRKIEFFYDPSHKIITIEDGRVENLFCPWTAVVNVLSSWYRLLRFAVINLSFCGLFDPKSLNAWILDLNQLNCLHALITVFRFALNAFLFAHSTLIFIIRIILLMITAKFTLNFKIQPTSSMGYFFNQLQLMYCIFDSTFLAFQSFIYFSYVHVSLISLLYHEKFNFHFYFIVDVIFLQFGLSKIFRLQSLDVYFSKLSIFCFLQLLFARHWNIGWATMSYQNVKHLTSSDRSKHFWFISYVHWLQPCILWRRRRRRRRRLLSLIKTNLSTFFSFYSEVLNIDRFPFYLYRWIRRIWRHY